MRDKYPLGPSDMDATDTAQSLGVSGGIEYRRSRRSVPGDGYMRDTDNFLGPAAGKEIKRSHLDSVEAGETHARLMGHYIREIEVQAPWRTNMARDEAFYDSEQWSAEDAKVLEARGQKPSVFNVIAQSINWIIGSQKRARVDAKILPRKKEGSRQAERKSQLLKYLADVNRSHFAESDAFAECAKAGLSWIESGTQSETEGEPIYDRYESWRNIIIDSVAREKDLSDSRYMFRQRWVDLDTAVSMFPDRAAHLRLSAQKAYEYGVSMDDTGDEHMDVLEVEQAREGFSTIDAPSYQRDRVRLIECWYRVPTTSPVVAGGEFNGELFDPSSPGHVEQIQAGVATIKQRPIMRMHVMVCTPSAVLWMSESPYRHNRFPFTPLWAYRKSSTGEPYGFVRNMIDAQEDINKRRSKALAILSSNKVIMDEGAVKDLDEFAEEVARPDAIIIKAPGKMLELNAERGLEAAHIDLMGQSIQMIQTLSGVTDEAMGRTTNASSGKAIMARQDQASVSTSIIFDNLRFARQVHGEKMLSLTEQFMTEQKQFRITNSRGQPDYVSINDGLPENDIVRTKADFIISEDAWSATMRQAQTEQMMALVTELAPVAPQVVIVLLDLLVEMMDVPSRDEVVKRIRQVTGMEDPDKDPNAPDPEREARDAAKAAEAEMAARAQQAELAKLEASAAKEQASATKAQADAAKVLASLPGDSLAQQRAALELAIQMLQAEPAVDTADALLVAAGAAPAPQIPSGAGPMPAPAQPDQMEMNRA